VLWAVKEKARLGGTPTARHRARNQGFGKVRAKGEHVSRIFKCQFGYRKVRYRGIANNGPRCSRCWRSQTCVLPAKHLLPPDDTRSSAPAGRSGWRH
jgi:IS5 family transposase